MTTKAMKPLIKAKFVAALRSKKYKQGFQRLKNSDGCFCVFGVLCDVFAKTKKRKNIGFDGNVFIVSKNDTSYFLPPVEVIEWAGLKHRWIKYNGKDNSLVALNDIEKLPFTKLADLIEAQL